MTNLTSIVKKTLITSAIVYASFAGVNAYNTDNSYVQALQEENTIKLTGYFTGGFVIGQLISLYQKRRRNEENS